MEPVAGDSIRAWLHRAWGPNLHIGRFRQASIDLPQAAAAANAEIAEHLALRPGNRVLDVGCGFGAMTHALAIDDSCVAVGIDPQRWRLEQGRRLHGAGLPLIGASALQLPFGSQTFDGCAALESLSYTECPADAVREMRRVVRHGGRIAILDYFAAPPAAGRPEIFPNDGRHLLTRDQWRQLVSPHGRIVCEEDWSADGAATYRWLHDVFQRASGDRHACLAAANMRTRLALLNAARVGHIFLVVET